MLNGTLYGTSEAGGSANEGTVFSITPSGTENVIHSFKGGTDAEQPMTPLVAVNGELFGTANGGGGQSGGGGTIFVVTPSGSEKVLYRFVGGNTDGLYPSSGLTNFHGKLYGVTVGGGKSGAGTVFVVSQTGSEKMLHAFGGVGHGASPYGGLAVVGNALYGTTREGGTGYGTVFKMTSKSLQTIQCLRLNADRSSYLGNGLSAIDYARYGLKFVFARELATGLCHG